MKNKKLKQLSLINLFAGYLMLILFSLLVMLNRPTELVAETQEFVNVKSSTEDEAEGSELFNGTHEGEKEIIYINGHPTTYIRDNSVDHDRLSGVILNDAPNTLVVRDDRGDSVAVIRNTQDENLLID